ncbi:diaminopimelate decarboxylase [Saccharopolyspora kobensis]|uniref:Diaminopimelate decarboxylase n=1 Tax=Saccharopolyspora kobensis TaxID=146035 RepID=A0A1H5U0I4_9PSEU|nr:diaminopimelate decarboxylase [Saccharopolyspora kobensis]SEF68553.1 diaminopimelate decarboxylase [Saccharopolyspora kobensis]SFC39799.1 diaminopimelate decarboxylase [Saccharopolyspora kobensis]
MTLAELLPTYRRSLPEKLPAEIWPDAAVAMPSGDLVVSGVSLTELADRFGTPGYVLDLPTLRARCRAYRALDAEIAYAGKAFLCRRMARLIAEEGLSLDVCSGGELATALSAGFPAERILLHGNAKTDAELRAAARAGVGRVVVDSLAEIDRLSGAQDVLIRVTPGVDGRTHRAVATGTEDQKFGTSLAGGQAAVAVARVLARPELRLVGLHCHLGSQITDISAYEEAVRRLVAFLAEIAVRHGVALPQLNLGGGHAVAYCPGDAAFDLRSFAARIPRVLSDECRKHGLLPPRLTLEPGRAIAARAGLTLYRVVTVKHSSTRTFVAVDGGFSDNPRAELYGARYTARLVGRFSSAQKRSMHVVGRHCEAGDVLIPDAHLPSDIRAGDLLAVPCTGAYHHSMASTYNLVPRPPVLALDDGAAELWVRRETEEDLLRRDTP